MAAVISPADARHIVAPLLPSLPGAAVSHEPASAVLPLLSPILRQRVQFLSASSTEPWIRLLSYDPSKAARLADIAQRLEPHPISGEIEVDWDADTEVRYKRVDVETLQALVFVKDLDLVFRLVYCVNDQEGGNGWKVGEVSTPDASGAFSAFGGYTSIAEAETAYKNANTKPTTNNLSVSNAKASAAPADASDEEDDDDDYWARYDATPARTPAVQRSPAPQTTQAPTANGMNRAASAEDAYFAQYDTVQPAMDPHDPDEAPAAEELRAQSAQEQAPPPPLGFGQQHEEEEADPRYNPALLHPRPESASSASSSAGAASVARLEELADRREQNEFGVRQHVGRSIKSLFLLARSSGIERDEFERLVRTELDVLGMMED